MDIVLVRNLLEYRTESMNTDIESNRLIDDIELVKRDIICCDEQYNMTDDFDLLEYFIYERKALTSKYRYLLNQAKSRGIVCNMEKIIRINEKGN